MASGRNRSVAACAFVLAMALGAGQASALDLNAPAGQLTAATGLPALPNLPTVPEILPTSPVTAAPAEPTPAESAAPAVLANDSAPVVASHSSGPVASTGRTFHTAGTAASFPGSRGADSAGAGSHTRRVRHLHRSSRRGTRQQLPTYEQSRFDRLGRALDLSSPPQFFGDFTGGGSSTGMSWAVPLLALMLPIGLCGILATVRQRQPSAGPGIDGRSSRLGK
jgi:hypothetical protein